jgi:hypothetical protein
MPYILFVKRGRIIQKLLGDRTQILHLKLKQCPNLAEWHCNTLTTKCNLSLEFFRVQATQP